MATTRDLVEAYSYSRRRLVTAFVSGAPGGREVEPARPGRTIVGGVALAVVLMAGSALSGMLAGRTEVDPNHPGLIVGVAPTRRARHGDPPVTCEALVGRGSRTERGGRLAEDRGFELPRLVRPRLAPRPRFALKLSEKCASE